MSIESTMHDVVPSNSRTNITIEGGVFVAFGVLFAVVAPVAQRPLAAFAGAALLGLAGVDRLLAARTASAPRLNPTGFVLVAAVAIPLLAVGFFDIASLSPAITVTLVALLGVALTAMRFGTPSGRQR